LVTANDVYLLTVASEAASADRLGDVVATATATGRIVSVGFEGIASAMHGYMRGDGSH
jgi:hypothetical protein